jgi:hypothetical protein
MEYGWMRALDNHDHEDDKTSVKSGRSGLSKLGGTYGRKSMGNVAAEKMYINDWKPPPAATMPSPLDEEAQVEALQAYVRSLMDELEQHKAVEQPMNRLVSLLRYHGALLIEAVCIEIYKWCQGARELAGEVALYSYRDLQVRDLCGIAPPCDFHARQEAGGEEAGKESGAVDD